MHINSYNLLLRHSPDRVVHQAIKAGLYGDDLCELVRAKINALTVEDDESGLLPFMMAAEINEFTINEFQLKGHLLISLTASYELLSMDPSVLQNYI